MITHDYKRLSIIALLIFSCQTYANQNTEGDEVEEEKTIEQQLIESNIAISQWFDSMAEGLDVFLVGKKITKQKSEARVKIENTTFSTEGDNLTNNTSFSIMPRLPNLEKSIQVKFTTYDEAETTRGAENNYLRQNPKEKNYGASVGFFKKLGNIRTAFQPRVELQDPLKVSHSLSFESIAIVNKFQINPKLELYASATKGVGIFEALNFNFFLNKKYTLTVINDGDYQEKQHLYSVTNGVSLGQSLSSQTALTYGLMFNSNNRPSYHLDLYTLSVTWNHVLYKKILDYQLSPHIDFHKIREFKGEAGIIFNVNLTF